MVAGRVSNFSDSGVGVALTSASMMPPSSQKKRSKRVSSFVRKSLTTTRLKKRHGYHADDKMRALLYAHRSNLRPLLDAIRFVESSNREDCPDGDGGASIGPLQISEHYHLDAWNYKHSIAWPKCRNLEHAENTVVAYWMRYGSDALRRCDWEILAKIHNGGPRGPQREKTSYYWSKVSKYLEQFYAPPPSSSEPSKPSALKKNNTLRSGGLKMLAAPFIQRPIINERRKALADITNRHSSPPYLLQQQQQQQQHKNECKENLLSSSSSSTLFSPSLSSPSPSLFDGKKSSAVTTENEELGIKLKRRRRMRRRRSQLHCSDSDTHMSLRDALHFGYWILPSSLRKRRAAVFIQSTYRMWVQVRIFRKMKQACLRIQRVWRKFRYRMTSSSAVTGSPVEGVILQVADRCHRSEAREVRRKSQEYWRAPESYGQDLECTESKEYSVDMLYSDHLPQQMEEEILTELAALLPLELVRRRQSFEFPAPPVTSAELDTPDVRGRKKEDREEEASSSSSSLSPRTEMGLLSELADLFHIPNGSSAAALDATSADDVSTQDCLVEMRSDRTAEYVKALFSCEDALLERLCEAAVRNEEDQERLHQRRHKDLNRSFSACPASLDMLCGVWEEENVDLLTRSLRYAKLASGDVVRGISGGIFSGMSPEYPGERIFCEGGGVGSIAWEMDALRSIGKGKRKEIRAKEEEKIKQQRDMMYVNVGSYASRKERSRLYSKWGVRKLGSGRLKRIVYELLWKDPEKYAHSAEFVNHYL